MFRSLALGLLVALGLIASRQAEATILDVSGKFDDGALLTGSFDFDFSTGETVSSNVSVGGVLLSVVHGSKIESDAFSIWVLDKTFGQETRSAILSFAVAGPPYAALPGSYYATQAGTFNLVSGSAAPASVVPIPAALPLAATALAGLGGLGWLKRRKSAHSIAASSAV